MPNRCRVASVHGDGERPDSRVRSSRAQLRPAARELSPTLRNVRRLATDYPPTLRSEAFAAWADAQGIAALEPLATLLAPLLARPAEGRIARLRERLFEPPVGDALDDSSVELLTAPGEAAEVRAVARRILREAARGVPFEEMGVLLARPEDYVRLFADLLTRLGIQHRLHPSLPLRFGRSARSLLLLFRCRGLRPAERMSRSIR